MAAMIILVLALGEVSEIVLPLTFAALLSVIFRSVDGILPRHWPKPPLAPAWSALVRSPRRPASWCLISGIVGLILAVPPFVIARTAATRRLLRPGSRPRRTDLATLRD